MRERLTQVSRLTRYGVFEREKPVAVALGLFDLGYVASKLISVALLGSVSGLALVTWFAAGEHCFRNHYIFFHFFHFLNLEFLHTAFLHIHAGLAFYYQLYYSSSDRFPPFPEYAYVQLVSETTDQLNALIRSQVTDQVFSLKLVRKSGARSVSGEMALHARASSASENVVSLKDRGSSSISS